MRLVHSRLSSSYEIIKDLAVFQGFRLDILDLTIETGDWDEPLRLWSSPTWTWDWASAPAWSVFLPEPQSATFDWMEVHSWLLADP